MIIIVFGLPGTGKSHFSEKLADSMQASYLNTDTDRKNLDFPSDYSIKLNYMVYDQLLQEMAAQINCTKKVIVEGTFHKEKVRNLFVEKARELRQDVFFIEIKTDDELMHERLKKRHDYSDAEYKFYMQLKSEFEPVYHPHLVLWSDYNNVEEMVEKANVYIYGQEHSAKEFSN